MTKVYISLGTNLGNKEFNLKYAIEQVAQSVGTITNQSSVYSSAPWGFSSTHTFYNQVIELETTQTALEVITLLLKVETAMGRNRKGTIYTDRIIDLDVLFYGNEVIESKLLTVPHPKLHLRNFILEPLLEIIPTYVHPTLHLTIEQLFQKSEDKITAYKK